MTLLSSRIITLMAMTPLMVVGLGQVAKASDTATAAPPAQEDTADEAVPLIAIEGSAELQLDAGTGSDRTTSLFATVEPEVTVNLSDAARLFGHFVYEPVLDPNEGETNVIRSQGFYAEELYAGLTIG